MVEFLVALYFLPTFLAFALNHPEADILLFWNLFTGWTIVGWIGALLWAVNEQF